jgi:hypothetical protein
MFQFKMNDAARLQFRAMPRWKIAALGVLGVALGVMLALLMAGLFIVLIPVLLIGGIAARFLMGPARHKQPPAPPGASEATIIDGDYKIVEPSAPDEKRN